MGSVKINTKIRKNFKVLPQYRKLAIGGDIILRPVMPRGGM
jgi:hypothetical protein